MKDVAERRDREAFARLFDHYVPGIEAYLMRLGADRMTAEEISQEVMITLWRKAHLFDPTSRPRRHGCTGLPATVASTRQF